MNSITANTANTLPVSDYNPPSSSHHLYIKPWGPSESALCIQFKRLLYFIHIRTRQGYTVKYNPLPEGVPEGEARGISLVSS